MSENPYEAPRHAGLKPQARRPWLMLTVAVLVSLPMGLFGWRAIAARSQVEKARQNLRQIKTALDAYSERNRRGPAPANEHATDVGASSGEAPSR